MPIFVQSLACYGLCMFQKKHLNELVEYFQVALKQVQPNSIE